MGSKNSKLKNDLKVVEIQDNKPIKPKIKVHKKISQKELVKPIDIQSQLEKFHFSKDYFDNFIPINHKGVFIHFPNYQKMQIVNRHFVLKEYDLTKLVQVEEQGRVETIFGYGISLVKLGRQIFRIVGTDLQLIGKIDSACFNQYCCNFMVFNHQIYVGGRNDELYLINVHEKKLTKVQFDQVQIATRPMADKAFFYDFKKGNTRIFDMAENPEFQSSNSQFFCLGVLYFSQGQTLIKVFKNNERVVKDVSSKFELGKYGIMLSKDQIGVYYDEVEEYMRQFVDEHLQSEDYVETKLDYLCNFDFLQLQKLQLQKQIKAEFHKTSQINQQKRGFVGFIANGLDSCCFSLNCFFEEGFE